MAGEQQYPQVQFAALRFDVLKLDEVIKWISARNSQDSFAYIVTPNADHAVRLHDHRGWLDIQNAYLHANLCLCDSKILSLLARLKGITLPPTPGSDVVELLLRHHCPPGKKLLLIGGSKASCAKLQTMLPGVEILQHQPPMGLLDNPSAIDEAVQFVTGHNFDIALFAVGSPQQELIAHRISMHPGATGTGLCIGAAVDFLTGEVRRAPLWMRALALEWLHRLLSNPRKLWRRYLIHSPRIFWIALTK